MVLEDRKCPNCGSTDILEKDGTYVCMSCRTFFDNPNEYKVTQTKVIRDEAELEKLKYRKEQDKRDRRNVLIVVGLFVAFIIFCLWKGGLL